MDTAQLLQGSRGNSTAQPLEFMGRHLRQRSVSAVAGARVATRDAIIAAVLLARVRAVVDGH